jgi:glycosyltransferase involved in cell wall biosynthesis
MKNAYCYIQPSDVEGLSPVILNVMGLGTPVICSDIKENIYIVSDNAILFNKGDIDSLGNAMEKSINFYDQMMQNAVKAKDRALSTFSWDKVTLEHETIFQKSIVKK